MSGAAGPRTKVVFRWACEDVQSSEEVRVVGDCPELGSWQPSMGVPLVQSTSTAACWTSKGVSLPLGTLVQYKYIICGRATGEDARWELNEDNRTVVPTGRRHVLEDDGGRYRQVSLSETSWHREVSGNVESLDPASGSNSVVCASPRTPKTRKPKLETFEQRLKWEQELEVTSRDNVLVVFRSLPFRLDRDKTGNWHVDAGTEAITFKVVSLLQRSLQADSSGEVAPMNVKFVGDPGVRTTDPEERKKIIEALQPHGCIPVFLDEQVAERTYEFCHRLLWPLMHNMKVFDDDASLVEEGREGSVKFDESQWKNYQVFNRAYADAIEPHLTQTALVWVHDFYLLLVPRYLSLRCPGCTVSLFLHSAFPSSEVLRCMPTREEILQSMLSCKVLTFQFFEYARSFLSCCQFLFHTTHSLYGAGLLQVEHEGESTVVRADHFVLSYPEFVARLENERVQSHASKTRKQFGDKVLFASIDGDEPFSGLILKLRAFQKLLYECPQHQHQVGLLQHVLPRRTDTGTGSDLMVELKRVAEEINGKYRQQDGHPVVVISTGDLSVDERIGTLQAADILLDTSINDGLNLHPFLFCIAHSKDMKGSMIVSEFCGCSSVLTGAVKVNPWHTQAVMDAMHTVVTMEDSEKARNFKQDHSYVSTQRLSQWVRQNLVEMKQAVSGGQSGPVKGLGAGSQIFSMECGFRHLNIDAVLRDYKQAKTRAIFLDTEGTLAPDRRSVLRPYGAQDGLVRSGQPLDQQVLECLQILSSDRGNVVTVISGRDRSTLDNWFAGVEGLGLCAEHGFYWVLPGKLQLKKGGDRWNCMEASSTDDDDWKTIVFQLMTQYVKRVQGSIVEYKGSAITWNYRKVGAQMLAKEVALELSRFLDPNMGPDSLMHGYRVDVVHGKGYVEVKRSDVDKGVAVSRVLREMRNQLMNIDFVLCIGDDRSDEDMFQVVNAIGKEAPSPNPDEDMRSETMASQIAPPAGMRKKESLTLEEFSLAERRGRPSVLCPARAFYTVTVGRKPSKAGHYARDVREVSDILHRLAMQTKLANLSRFVSMPSLARGGDSDQSDEG